MSEVSETPRGRLVPLLQKFCVFIMIVGSLNWGVTGIRMTMDAELDACAMHDGKSMVVDLLEPIGSQIWMAISDGHATAGFRVGEAPILSQVFSIGKTFSR